MTRIGKCPQCGMEIRVTVDGNQGGLGAMDPQCKQFKSQDVKPDDCEYFRDKENELLGVRMAARQDTSNSE